MKIRCFIFCQLLLVAGLGVLSQGCKMGVTVVDPSGTEAGEEGETSKPFHATSARTIDGKIQNMEDFLGKVALVVNTASNCGFTGQYQGLEALYDKYGERGFVVLGFPCNDFGDQEPGTDTEIQGFCSAEFSVSFPMFSKIHVVGPEKHPLYAKLTEQGSKDIRGDIKWNFTKFLVDRKGRVVARFAPFVTPESDAVVDAIERLLSAKN